LIRTNITANLIGQVLTAGIGFFFIPIYVRYLGVESYGLIGIFSIITAWLSILDAGFSTALTREMALFTGGKHTAYSIRTLLRSVEWFFLLTGSLIILISIPASKWLTNFWIKKGSIPSDVVIKSIFLMGFLFVVKFFESIYKNSFIGLQQQVNLNIYEATSSIIRAVGAFLLLRYISSSIVIFFSWQVILTILYIIFLKMKIEQLLPKSEENIKFSFDSLLSVKNFAGGMILIVILSLFHTQMDKIILSKMLSLKDFGYYTIAFTLAGSIMIFTSPVSQAIYPKLNQLYQRGESIELLELFHLGNQIISVIVGSISVLLYFYSNSILFLWTSDSSVVQGSYYILSILSLGFLSSGINTMPAALLMTYNRIRYNVYIKLISIFISTPLLLFYIPNYGSIASAFIWLFVVSINTILTLHFLFLKDKLKSFVSWFIKDIFQPLIPVVIFIFLTKEFIALPASKIFQILTLLIYLLISIIFSILFSNILRLRIFIFFKIVTQ
jgi:O-antigen/teichoic acid export membrane protein